MEMEKSGCTYMEVAGIRSLGTAIANHTQQSQEVTSEKDARNGHSGETNNS